MDLLLIADDNKSRYVNIKDFSRFMCKKTKHKNKKLFCQYYLQCFSNEKILATQKKFCLKINGRWSIKLRNRSIKFSYHCKQLAVSFKTYADFESALKGVQTVDDRGSSNVSYIFLLLLQCYVY